MMRGRLEEGVADAAATVAFVVLPEITGGGEAGTMYLGMMAWTENCTCAVGDREDNWI